MHFKTHVKSDVSMDPESPEAEIEVEMSVAEVCAYAKGIGRCVLVVDEMVVDVTTYMDEHVRILRCRSGHPRSLVRLAAWWRRPATQVLHQARSYR